MVVSYARALVNGVPLLVLASLTLTCLALRRPKPRAFPFGREPGLILSLTIVIVAAGTAALPARFFDPIHDGAVLIWKMIVFGVITNVGCAVLVVLILLKTTGRYGPAQSTADAIGRALAWLWAVLLLLERCRSYLESIHIM
jgi:hypothetical protein